MSIPFKLIEERCKLFGYEAVYPTYRGIEKWYEHILRKNYSESDFDKKWNNFNTISEEHKAEVQRLMEQDGIPCVVLGTFSEEKKNQIRKSYRNYFGC